MMDRNLIRNVVIIGAGHQGHAIAQGALMGNFDRVVLNSTTMTSILNGVDRILNSNSYGLNLLERKRLLPKGCESSTLLKKLVLESDLKEAVKTADLVIECAYEKLEVKKKIFKTLGKYCPSHAILATNTSTMSISTIGKASKRESNVVGMHFLNPLGSRLVEITKGKLTSLKTVEMAKMAAQEIKCLKGRRTIIILQKESPGFVTNRIVGTIELYFTWCINEAFKRGISFEELDADVIHILPKGLCKMCDLMGIDTIFNSFKYLESNLSSDFKPCGIFESLIKEGRLGKKVGKGFYDWSKGEPIINRSERAKIVNPMLIQAILLNEGCKVLEEKIVKTTREVDIAIYEGYHMPGPFSNGIKKYRIFSAMLEELSKKTGYKYLKPCKLLKTGEFQQILNKEKEETRKPILGYKI
ncbi:MAG: 3-hydroxyacyl-CoA dehydrogenase family protein [Candidatus Lokiarchaeota archaeon]|nr:3-hydroxyacyl-CoA dehydrogenase family protein [Candidatus Lokiarchaeota archaeon]